MNSFKTVGEYILESTVKDDKVTNLSNRGISQFLEIISAINEYLLRIKKIFYCISKNSQGPYHLGWSRLVSEMQKSKSACRLLQYESTIQKIGMEMRPNGGEYQPSRQYLRKGGIEFTEI